MANITQKITSYVHGISQQPDHLKKPGQVRNLLNVLPDVTTGLMKRPGSEVISFLDTLPAGKWFTIFRDDNEKYLGLISADGLRIWSLIDGLPRIVRYNSTPDLEHPEDGGVPLPPNPGEDPTDPPGNPKPPAIPDTCDLVAMQTALDNWLKKKSEVSSIEADYNAENRHLSFMKSRASEYKPAVKWPDGDSVKQGYAVSSNGCGTIQRDVPEGSKMAERRSSDFKFDIWTVERRCYYESRGWYTPGDFTDQEIAAQAAKVRALQSQLDKARYELIPIQNLYEDQAILCGITSLPGAYATKTVSPFKAKPIPYLEDAEPYQIDVLTVNDYTIITNTSTRVMMGADKSRNRPNEAFLEVKALEYNTEYWLELYTPGATQGTPVNYATSLTVSPAKWEDGDGSCPFIDRQDFTINDGTKTNLRFTVDVRGNPIPSGSYDYDCRYYVHVTLINGGQNWVTGDTITVDIQGRKYTVTVASHSSKLTFNDSLNLLPYLTPQDQEKGILKVDAILAHFQTEIEKHGFWSAVRIGNGLYIKGPKPFSAAIAAGRSDQAMQVMTNQVNDVSKLPIQCKDGYVVKVVNSGNNEDDYYLEFKGTERGADGAGVWEETVKPGLNINFNYHSMPHQIVRMPDGSFMVSPIDWERRLVGDKNTNPEPSFVNKTINKTIFYRNRLGFLSDENIILSRAGDFFNFFVKTAITVSDSDPIDVACSSTTPCVLHNAVGAAAGLVLFSQDKQFLFGTSQDILSPRTAKVDIISSYECDTTTPVIDMGLTIGFVASKGKYSKFQEMKPVSQGKSTEVLEESKIVQELLPANLDLITGSKDDDIVAFSKKGTRQVYFYKYFDDGERRILSTWYTWTCPGDLVFHAVGKFTYYAVYSIGGKLYLTKTATSMNSEKVVISSSTPARYSPHLDVKHTVLSSEITYDPIKRESSFNVWHPYTTEAVVFNVGDNLRQGSVTPVMKVEPNGYLWKVTVSGNWSNNDLQIGYPFKMEVDLPHFYYTQESPEKVKTDTRMYLTIHRAKIQLAKIGLVDITVNRIGKEATKLQYEASPADYYRADEHEVMPTTIYSVPIYEKNTNTNITLTSTYPTPCTLLSIEWEGKISPKSYKSV